MDGYETAQLIRPRKRTAHIPIVFLTAVFRDEAHLFQAYSAGAVDVVFKPVDPFILRSKVAVLVDLHLKTAGDQRQAGHRQRLLEENARVQRREAARPSGRCAAPRSGRRRSSSPCRSCSTLARAEPPLRAAVRRRRPSRHDRLPGRGVSSTSRASARARCIPRTRTGGQALRGARRPAPTPANTAGNAPTAQYRSFLDQGVLAPATTASRR